MIGDTKLDLIAAKDAGVKGVGVLSGYGDKTELSLYTDIVEENSLDAVKKIIEL
jgi:phosphoglycolate phosphatase